MVDLIDEDLRMWNKDLVFQCFEQDEAMKIVNIPLASSHLLDKRIWHFEKSGEFSVRSTYHLSLQARYVNAPSPSRPPCQKLWKAIWKAPVHNRVKNFLWRATKNILPLKHNLLKKGVNFDPACSLCNQGMESVNHLFTECDFARTTFFSSIMCYKIPCALDFNDWLLCILTCGDVMSSQILCTLVYKVWLARNLKLYQMKDSSLVKVAVEAVEQVEDFNKWNQVCKGVDKILNDDDTDKREVHFIHFDASFSEADLMTTGYIIRDHNQVICIASCRKEEVQVEVAVGEAMAVRWGLSLDKALKLEKVVVKTDAKVVEDYANGLVNLVALDAVIVDIKLLFNSFHFSSVLFHSRLYNFQAHNLVKLAYFVGSRTWIREYPTT